MTKVVDIEVVRGSEGSHLEVSNPSVGIRIAGPKAYGGGTITHKFTVDLDSLVNQAKEVAYEADN